MLGIASALAFDNILASFLVNHKESPTPTRIMARTKNWIRVGIPGCAGALVALGWWICIDAIMWQHSRGGEITASWLGPGLFASFAGCLVAVTPVRLLSSGTTFYGAGGGGAVTCARCWLFCAFTASFSAILSGLAFATSSDEGEKFIVVREGDAEGEARGEGEGEGEGEWNMMLPIAYSAWPGIAMVIQTSFIFAGSMLWISARAAPSAQNSMYDYNDYDEDDWDGGAED